MTDERGTGGKGGGIPFNMLLRILHEEGFDFENQDVLPGLRLRREDLDEMMMPLEEYRALIGEEPKKEGSSDQRG